MQPQYPYQQQPQSSYQAQAPYQQSPYQAQPQLRYVGFWWRVLAFSIDTILLSIVSYLTLVTHIPQAVFSVISILYLIGLEATLGGTVGKLVLGLRVRKVDGSPIGWKEAIIRNLMLCVEEFTLFIVTIITMNNSPMRQRWGDRVAGTVVVKI